MELNRGTRKLLHLRQSNPAQPYRLAGDCLAARLLVLNVNHKCTLAAVKAKHVLVQSVSQGQ